MSECAFCHGTNWRKDGFGGQMPCIHPAAETVQPSRAEDCEPRTLKEWAEALVCETTGRYLDCDISLVEFEQDTAIATKYLTMFAAPLRERIATLEAECPNDKLARERETKRHWKARALKAESELAALQGEALRLETDLADARRTAEYWKAEHNAGNRTIAALRAEHAEMDALFDLRWKADMRAIKQWQRTHPGNDLVWPDHADLVVWLAEGYADLVETNCRMSRQLAETTKAITEKTQKAADEIFKEPADCTSPRFKKSVETERAKARAILARIFGEQP